MDEKQLFGMALGLTPPWFIDKVSFDNGTRIVVLQVDDRREMKGLTS